jgi:hypothetical protein
VESFDDTLDILIPSLLTCVTAHPSTPNRSGGGIIGSLLQRQKRVGLDTDQNGNRVAVSPIYTAPEIFIYLQDAPTAFDNF